MGVFHQKVSNVVSLNRMRVNFLAMARWLQEVVLCAVLWMQAKVKGNFVVSGTLVLLLY